MHGPGGFSLNLKELQWEVFKTKGPLEPCFSEWSMDEKQWQKSEKFYLKCITSNHTRDLLSESAFDQDPQVIPMHIKVKELLKNIDI